MFRFTPALMVAMGLLGLVPPSAGASVTLETGAGVRAEVWSAVPVHTPKAVPTRDPAPVATAEPFVDGDVRCTWVGHVLPDASTRPEEQRERCDPILALLRPARAFVDGLLGSSYARGIELIVLDDPINERANVAAQTTSVRAGTVACYRPGQFGDDPDCGGLPVEGALARGAWTCQMQVSGEFLTRDRRVQRSTLAHEYFHCRQRDRSPESVATFTPSRRWLVEGSAAWIGEQYAGGSPISGRWWNQAVHASESRVAD